MVDNLDDLMETDLTGLVVMARKHGPDSAELEEYVLKTLQHYPNKESTEEYKMLAAGFLLIIYDL